MDAIELLIAQHRSLESQLEDALAAGAGGSSASKLADLGDLLSVHMASEEQVFYPAVKAGRTVDVLLESLEEHLSLKRLLADLLELPAGGETYEPKLKVLAEQSEHHHKEEEEHLFPEVRKLLDADRLKSLGDEMLALQKRLRRDGEPREAVAQQTGEAAPLA